jgi:predicted NACHT family NTPase
VLLSSSYSSEAAKLISQDINYVIGMKQAIVKQAVIAFVKSFYDGLGCENSNNQSVIQKAFDQGLSASKEKGSKDLQSISIPVLRTKTQIEYYSWLINNYQKYQTEGLSKDCTLELPKVFVPLKIAPNYLENIHSELIWQVSNGTNNVREDQIWHRLVATVDEDQNNQACRRMVVLGGQGSGKSTLLKHLTLIYASEEQHQYHPQAPEFIPVLLLIRNLYQKIVENEKMSLADLIAEQVKQIIKEDQMIQPVSRWLIEELNRKKDNKCLIMLDGLDEVADETQRQQVSAWVDEQIQSYPNTTFILTSRPRGYKTASLKNVGIVLEAQPFKLDQIRSFIHKWYLETEKIRLYGDDILKIKKHAQQQAENLINRIRNSSQLAVMVVNPLLLTMITRLHHQLSINNRSLPEKRVELYKEMCEVLLEKRQKDKSIPDTLQVQDKQSVLQVLALKLMQQEKTEFKLADGTSWIKKQLTNVVSNQVNPKEFIEYIRDVSNFLVENDLKSYQFAHLSFQEYLAAYQIKEFNKEKLLISNIGNSWWAETIRLYAAQSDATKLIDAVLDMQSPSVDVMALAYDCLEESLKKVDDKVGQKLIRRLKEGLESTDPEIFKLAAQVTLIRRFRNFVPISEELEIDKSYITCAEYQLFLDETGEPRQSQHWQSKRFSAGDAKKPIRGISRENALRFCAWLGQKFGNQISEVATHYRLLTEEDLNQFEEEINQYSINNAQLFLESGIHLVKFQLPSIYSQLAYYLWCGEWQKADEETVKLMLEIAARKGRKSLNSQNIKKFTCEDLRIIDQLWVYASKGHFGFSVQKSIYQSLGGTGEDDDKIWTAFVDHIGWTREGGEWLECEGLIYDMNAPKGHLPVLNNEENMVVYLSEKFEQWWILSDPKVFSSLARKLKDCNITPGSRLQLPSEI